MLGHNSFEAMITPHSQSPARLPCPIHDDDSGRRRRAENTATGGRGVRRSELTIITVISEISCYAIGSKVLVLNRSASVGSAKS
ncbi:MAG: hypothetical protein QOG79_7615 [Mycobacterium sp.]|nr:hypothetical protein [Mycobacterium sp.]